LYDIGVVNTKEPYQKRTSHGMILGENGEKMSKSRGNVINPDDVINEVGADAFRVYEMFIGAFDLATPWSTNGVKGCYKFLERVWNMQNMVVEGDTYSKELENSVHKLIKKVSDDIEKMKFNTAIAAMMSFVNECYKKGSVTKAEFKTFLTLLNPFAPHITEELWQLQGFLGTIAQSSWPTYDEAKTIDDEVEIVIKVCGKIRAKKVVSASLSKEELEKVVLESDEVKALTEGKEIVKVIVVPGKLVNLVVK